jgi:hypothetical protein
MMTNPRKLSVTALLGLGLAACSGGGSGGDGGAPSPSAAPTVSPTPSASPAPTATPVPTASPTPGATPNPTATPTPTPIPTPTPGSGTSASACFNDALTTVGIGYQAVYGYEVSFGDDQGPRALLVDTQVTRQTSFDGRPATEVESLIYINFDDDTVPDPDSEAPFQRVRQYLNRSQQTPTLTLIGTETRAQPTLPDDELLRPNQQAFYVPGIDFRFALQPGQLYEQTYQSEQFFGGSRVSQSALLRTTYIGRERVTVPAGSFDTCKFEIASGQVQAPPVIWVDTRSGIIVRQQGATAEGFTAGQTAGFNFLFLTDGQLELIRASINGVPVTPAR